MLTAILFLGCTIATLLFTATHALAFRFAAAPIEEISVFFGPTLWHGAAGPTRLSVRLMPLGGYVKVSEEAYASLGVMVRLAVILSAPLVLLAMGLLLAGGQGSLLRISLDVVQGTLHPIAHGSALLDAFLRTFQRAPVAAIGAFLVAFALINLIPLSMTCGGQALCELLDAVAGPLKRTRTVFLWLSVPAMLGAPGAWILAWWMA